MEARANVPSMGTKIFILSIAVVIMSACASQPRGVNPQDSTAAIVVANILATFPRGGEPTGSIPKNSTIEGTVMTAEDIPVPLAMTRLDLFKKAGEKWVPVASATTERDGGFRFTQDMQPGLYELRLQSDRYEGAYAFNLQGPLRQFVFEAKLKN